MFSFLVTNFALASLGHNAAPAVETVCGADL